MENCMIDTNNQEEVKLSIPCIPSSSSSYHEIILDRVNKRNKLQNVPFHDICVAYSKLVEDTQMYFIPFEVNSPVWMLSSKSEAGESEKDGKSGNTQTTRDEERKLKEEVAEKLKKTLVELHDHERMAAEHKLESTALKSLVEKIEKAKTSAELHVKELSDELLRLRSKLTESDERIQILSIENDRFLQEILKYKEMENDWMNDKIEFSLPTKEVDFINHNRSSVSPTSSARAVVRNESFDEDSSKKKGLGEPQKLKPLQCKRFKKAVHHSAISDCSEVDLGAPGIALSNILGSSLTGVIVTCGRDGLMSFIEKETLKVIRTISATPASLPIDRYDLLERSNIALVAASDYSIYVLDVERQTLPRVMNGHSARITFCQRIRALYREAAISLSLDRTIRLWDIKNGICTVLNHADSCFTSGTQSLDGNTIVTGCKNGNIYLFSSKDPLTKTAGLPLDDTAIAQVCIACDGYTVFARSNSSMLYKSDIRYLEVMERTYSTNSLSKLGAGPTLSPAQNLLATANGDTVKIWRASDLDAGPVSFNAMAPVTCMSWKFQDLVTCDTNGTVALWSQ